MKIDDNHLERATALAEDAMSKFIRAGVDPGALAIGFSFVD